MNVVFANQKGGVGKSTLCALFASYLSNNGCTVKVIDLDNQKTLGTKRKNEEMSLMEMREGDSSVFDNVFPYALECIDPQNIVQYLMKSSEERDIYHLFDTPANVTDKNVVKTMLVADVIVIPIHYESSVLDSTVLLLEGLTAIGFAGKLYFVPNKVKSGLRFDSVKEVNELLSSRGVVTPIIADKADIMRYSTLEITKGQELILKPIFDVILSGLVSD